MREKGVVVLLFVIGLFAGNVAALQIYNTEVDWHVFERDSASSIYTIQDEPSDFSDVTLFCPLDAMDTTNNVTSCYLNGQIVNATIYFNTSTGYPKLVSGRIGNAFEFNKGSKVSLSTSISSDFLTFVWWAQIKAVNQDWANMWQLSTSGSSYLIRPELSTNEKIYITFGGTSVANSVVKSVYTTSFPESEPHFYVLKVDLVNKVAYFSRDLGEWVTFSIPAEFNSSLVFTTLNIGPSDEDANIVEDEFRLYTRELSDDELKLLYFAGRKKLSEPANLTISSVTFDGSKFDITVNVTLPSGAQYIYLPRDAVVDATTVQNWSTGHKLIDVSGKNWITVTLPAAVGSSPAGVNKLVVETDEALYLYGSGTYTLANPSPKLFQATNYISSGKVTQVGFSEPALTKRDPLPITLGGGSGTITVDQFSLEHVKLNVQSVASPITLQPSLLPLTKYTVAKDMNKVGEYESNTGGEFTFTIDATGLWEIFKSELGLSLAGDYIIKVIITTILVGIFAMIVVEATPVKFDDQATRAMLTLIAIVILAALVKLLVFAR